MKRSITPRRFFHLRQRIVATAAAVILGSHAQAFPIEPWEPGRGGCFVTDADGRTRYVWPPVPDDYLQTGPLGEIADWLSRAWAKQAAANNWNPKRSDDDMIKAVTIRCFGNPTSSKIKPLTPVQWNTLAYRAAETLSAPDQQTSDGAMRLIRCMDGFPIDAEWPLDGFRVLASALILSCMDSEPGQSQPITRMTAGFAIRSGDTAFLRRVMDRIRLTHDARQRMNLAELAAVCVPYEHDLNPAEAAITAGELLALAETLSGQPQQAGIAFAALNIGGNASIRLMENSLASGDAGIRRAAVRWAAERTRISRFWKDFQTERHLRDRADLVVAAIRDQDERVAAEAVIAITVILDSEPDKLAAILMNGLGTRPTSVDIAACSALARIPRRARPAMETLHRLSASPDPDLRAAAIELVRAIEAAEE